MLSWQHNLEVLAFEHHTCSPANDLLLLIAPTFSLLAPYASLQYCCTFNTLRILISESPQNDRQQWGE